MPLEIIGILTVLGVFIANAAMIIPLFLWNRQESRNDWRYSDAKFSAHQKETSDLIKAIQEEMKDFHIRLLMIEKEKVIK